MLPFCWHVVFLKQLLSRMRAKGQEDLVVSSSLVLPIISKDRFLAYYIDDCNAGTMGDARTDPKSRGWSHSF